MADLSKFTGVSVPTMVVNNTATDGQAFATGKSPQEIVEQLQRDATSLELTGASFDKDDKFYRAVATNLRFAAGVLSAFQKLTADHPIELQKAWGDGRDQAYLKSAEIARQVGRLMHPGLDGPADVWRSAAHAIEAAIHAVTDSTTMQPEVKS
jgi:hypothetical protein